MTPFRACKCGKLYKKKCRSCSTFARYKSNPEKAKYLLDRLQEGRDEWIKKRRLSYLKSLIGDIKANYSAVEAAKIANKAYKDGKRASYTAGYTQAQRVIAGRWTNKRSNFRTN